ncbi:MAG: SAM-dependent DNA methyltransferase [Chloroflexi bacterium]|nr:SAM-dependent DNA methyltransferase [Chloroflexota bacterium]
MAVANNNEIEKRLWEAADELRANSKLRAADYSAPVLGLIFLRYADTKFSKAQAMFTAGEQASTLRRRGISKLDYQAQGIMFLPDESRWSTLMQMPESANIGQAINDAMRAIESENPDLKDVLPKTYNRLSNQVLFNLLKNFNAVPMEVEGDTFGKIYEYFLGKFAMSEGQRGGEFFTPTALVKLIVEIIEPFKGKIYDPACGSGGMFVQSAYFRERHRASAQDVISIYGMERVAETVRLCKMNLAVHGLGGDIRQANSYYEDPHASAGTFDFVMANPPFNVDKIDKERLKDDSARFPFGMPRTDNGNYLWIQLFYSSLAAPAADRAGGRAGFVMANSASDARQSELLIRQQLIEDDAVDVMVAIGSNFFYTVTLPCTLWFLDKGKSGTPREDQVLFLDARNIYQQIDRAHRDFTPEQIGFLSSLVRLYRGEELNGYEFNPDDLDLTPPQAEQLTQIFAGSRYGDVAGLCKVVPRSAIEAQGWSLNPGRYVGVSERAADDFIFSERLIELNEELEVLNNEAHELNELIAKNITSVLGENL